jgi:hypothetical protein
MSPPTQSNNTPAAIALGAWELGPVMCQPDELREFFCGYGLVIGVAFIAFAFIGAAIAVAAFLI